MSTTYGGATVQFPGFKPVRSSTTDGVLDISHRRRPRSLEFTDGSRRRLSKRERSQLLTQSRKWHRQRYVGDGRWVYPFNTLECECYC
ncbi:MAG: hypothetical protein KBC33_01960 [Candidatus Pacebacteria bacterium]|nr:hypothetical protein [Candidatus Paceibacterota bacterium]